MVVRIVAVCGVLVLTGCTAVHQPSQSATPSVPPGGTLSTSKSRGYVTTPAELRDVADRATKGIEPYQSAVVGVKSYATADPSHWPHFTIEGQQSCADTEEPSLIWGGSPLVQAKAMVYHLTGDERYAADVRLRLLDLIDTHGYNSPGDTSDRYSGANQCILNLSWYLAGWIIAADLIEDYPGWTSADKAAFQKWLAEVVFRKVEWASDVKSNNWGTAGSATTAMIADYLTASGILMTDRNGVKIGSRAAYLEAKQRQIDRMNGNTYMNNTTCNFPEGIRPDGGQPGELGRGPTGCDGAFILPPHDLTNPSWTYPQTAMRGLAIHAELLLRRGDNSIYEHMRSDGAGSFRKAILFLLHNPNDPLMSAPWFEGGKQTLEFAYRYYRDPHIAEQLRIGTTERYVGTAQRQMVHFGTITHGFATNEDPGPPPTVPPPVE
jgi:hypothetical protein